MELFRRAPGAPSKLGVLPGTFNPPTRAHLELARAAFPHVDEVLFVLPRVFPHKAWEGARFDERLNLLLQATSDEARFSVAASDCGLFREIADACLEEYGSSARLSFICGRDAADRIVNWDYPDPEAVPRMLEWFDLLVASRGGEYKPPPGLCASIRRLGLPPGLDEISATEVRRRIAAGEPWEHLVPASIITGVRRIYGLPAAP